jgi:hypothetical protein
MWVATSHSYDFFIHYTSPVLTGAQEHANMTKSVAKTAVRRTRTSRETQCRFSSESVSEGHPDKVCNSE